MASKNCPTVQLSKTERPADELRDLAGLDPMARARAVARHWRQHDRERLASPPIAGERVLKRERGIIVVAAGLPDTGPIERGQHDELVIEGSYEKHARVRASAPL